MRRRGLIAAFPLGALTGALLWGACGAERWEAPAPPGESVEKECRSLPHLMPGFMRAIRTGRTEGLRTVVEQHLLKAPSPGQPPPISDVVRALFGTMASLAQQPPEVGAPPGLWCVPPAAPGEVQLPTLEQANELCEGRRALDLLIRRRQGFEALALVEPRLQAVLNYIVGAGRGADVRRGVAQPHFELAESLGGMCAQDGFCQFADGLDLLIELAAFAQTPEGRRLVDQLARLLSTADGGAKSELLRLLDPDSLSEETAVAMAKALVPALVDADPRRLQRAFDEFPLPTPPDGGVGLREELQPLLDDLKGLLGRPGLLAPMRASVNCVTHRDPDFGLVRMGYRLGLRDRLPEFQLERLVGALRGLAELDRRGSILFVGRAMARSIRTDEAGLDAAARVCRTVFSTARSSEQPRSNAELALPVMSELLANQVGTEALTALDALLFGCTGGR